MEKSIAHKSKRVHTNKFLGEIYKDNIEMFENFEIDAISFYLQGRKKEYNKKIETSLFNKFKYAVTKRSRPFTYDEARLESYVLAKACGSLVFYSKNRKITIDICDSMFFWGEERKLKYAFVSKELTRLIITEIKKIKDQKDVYWIADVLTKISTEPYINAE
jgi:hypothetical protein